MGLVDEGQALRDAFGSAMPEHFEWQTRGEMIAERERALVESAFLPLGTKVLDLGCGEGATLVHLGEPEGAVGVDLFEDKIAFARKRLPRCRFVKASVYELPFEDGSFDHVLVRDVVHHLETPARFVDEVARVLTVGGRVDVLEPCRNNPLIFMHAVTNRAERGELRSTPAFLERLIRERFQIEAIDAFQAFPIHRLVFHPDIGRPSLARNVVVRSIVDGIERLADRFAPAAVRAYVRVRAVRRALEDRT